MEFTPIQLDALQELANIGAAHSATTLSMMLNCHVSMNVPEIDIVDIGNMGQLLTDDITTLVVFELQGEIPRGGFLVLHFPGDSAVRTANILIGSGNIIRPSGEMDKSAILEVGNIMISSFLSATSDLLGIIMLPSPPVLVIDMTHAVIESLIAGMTTEVNEVVVFRINLASDEHEIAANIMIFLEVSTLQMVAEMLEKMIKPEP
ncbi:MAG: chemotaxis protein CheC [Methanomicrobiales archaeon]|nr:chemotaxis protein CheC [Methanomicrobiales archaeon]